MSDFRETMVSFLRRIGTVRVSVERSNQWVVFVNGVAWRVTIQRVKQPDVEAPIIEVDGGPGLQIAHDDHTQS